MSTGSTPPKPPDAIVSLGLAVAVFLALLLFGWLVGTGVLTANRNPVPAVVGRCDCRCHPRRGETGETTATPPATTSTK